MIAEAVSQAHNILIITCPDKSRSHTGISPRLSMTSKLPMNLSREEDSVSETGTGITPSITISDVTTVASSSGTEKIVTPGDNLNIAWQYGKYLKKGH